MKKIVLTTEQMDKISEYVSTEETTQEEINEGVKDDRYGRYWVWFRVHIKF